MTVYLSTKDQITRLADELRRCGNYHYAALADAAALGGISLTFAWRGCDLSMGQIKRAGGPVLVVIGDDDHLSTGPAGWPKARALVSWCRWFVIHGTGTNSAEYRDIADAAASVGRLLLVETASVQIEAWRALAPLKPGVIFVPSNGGPHPIMGTRH